VSIQAWGTACITVITLVGEVVGVVLVWTSERLRERRRKQREKMKVAMEAKKSAVGGEKKDQ
jgi:hypothetical protein